MFIEGYLAAVPTANRDKFRAHAGQADAVFLDHGATRVVDCWGDDVPDGKLTDFRKAVKAQDDEAVTFGWVEWPDKATRDKGMAKMMDPDFSDPRMDPEQNPMPFDGKRMVFGGFEPVVNLGERKGKAGYVDGFVLAVPDENRAKFIEHAQSANQLFIENGATRVLENWGADVPDGKVTDFAGAVQAKDGETVCFSFIEWPDKATRDACNAKIMSDDFEDERMDMEKNPMPFDGQRMIYAGFEPVFEEEK